MIPVQTSKWEKKSVTGCESENTILQFCKNDVVKKKKDSLEQNIKGGRKKDISFREDIEKRERLHKGTYENRITL